MINLYKFKKKVNFSSILTTGRTGSDYLHACLDNVPGIVTFSGSFFYYEFIRNLEKKIENYRPETLLNIFIKKNKHLFYTDKIENKKINLNLKKFKKIFVKIANYNHHNKINFFLSLYLSYHLMFNKNHRNIKTIIHHSHHTEETKNFLKDFKNASVLITVRDPRANLKSGILNWIKYDPSKENAEHFLFYLKRIREDLVFAFKVKKKLFVKLEEANFKKTKRRILKFLKVNYHKNFEIATFLRKSWSGDKLSNFKDDKKGKFNEEVKNKDWNLFFSKKDKQVLNFIYYDYRVFGYNFNKIYFNSFLYFMIFSLMPLSFEKKLFSVDYLFNQHKYKKYKFLNLYFYLKRILYFYYVLFDTMFSHINRKK
tara:strand:- start:15574 stop:16680 length:1107 start_codon:yes stop_codon:yes gene_type:complete